ncbi:MAG: hypothetical protein RL375_4095 [Pseudomonadota bacterium]|jgi:ribulose-5-phosphate 4-epimerase/fuculose-1-phosphate aldolase
MSATIRHQVSAEEWQLRTDLAACYPLIALYGWSDLVLTHHVSARLLVDEQQVLNTPTG